MEQVLTGWFESVAIIATTALESTPPDKNAPSGTSAIMRRRIESFSRSINSSDASVSEVTLTGVNGMSQYCRGSARARPRFNVNVNPGGNLFAPRKMVRGSGM